MMIVLIIIVVILGGYTLSELNSMNNAVGHESLMAVRRAQTVLSADCGGLSSVALAVPGNGRSPPLTSFGRDYTAHWYRTR